MTEQSLTLKYRPAEWKHVVGQSAIVRSMKEVLASKSNRAFLFIGPSGCGKTTLARLAAKEVGCEDADIKEIDAATFTSIDDMRQVTQGLRFKTFSGKPRMIIINEVHRLSPQAFDSLLMPIEEPPKDVYFCLTTTNLTKVPAAIQTRCTKYTLDVVDKKDLTDLLEDIAKEEKIVIGDDQDLHERIIDLCVKEAQGSPRAAIVNLGACLAARDLKDARELLRSVEEAGAPIDLARALIAGAKWDRLKPILETLAAENPENVRHVVRSYMTKALLGNGKNPGKLFHILQCFSEPFSATDGLSPLVLACGKVCFSED